jgi:NAD-dependent oxidoreductase involved in siderophore biosynthesis
MLRYLAFDPLPCLPLKVTSTKLGRLISALNLACMVVRSAHDVGSLGRMLGHSLGKHGLRRLQRGPSTDTQQLQSH